MVLEDLQRLVHGQVEHVGHGEAVVLHGERRLVEAPPVADLAGHVDVGQEVHLDPLHPVALAGLAAAPLHVEGEAPRGVAVHPRLGQEGEEVADEVEELRVGGRVRARGPPDRALVDVDDLVDLAEAVDPGVRPHRQVAPVQRPRDRGVEDVVDEGALPRAGDAGHAHEEAQGEGRGDPLQVVLPRAGHRDLPPVALPPLGRDLDAQVPPQVPSGQAGPRLHDLGRGPRGHDLAAVAACAGAEVHEPVRLLHRLVVVLDHHHRVADVAQVLERGQQLLVVALVEADRRLVEHVDDAGQLGPDLAGQADPLALAAGEAGGRAVEGQVGEAHVEQEAQARADLLEELRRDLRVGPLEREAVEEGEGVRHGEGGDLRDRLPRDLHPQGLGANAAALARRAGPRGEVLLVVLPHLLRLRLPHPPHHRVDGALVAHLECA